MHFDDLDLVILKTITTNKKYALEFVQDYNEKIFDANLWRFAKAIADYIRIYKEVPTKRVILERAKTLKNDAFLEYIELVYSKLESIQYDDREYKHDLEKIKKRFSEKKLLDSRNILSKLESGAIDVNKSVFELQKTIQDIKGLECNKSFNVKNIKDYLPTFVDKYNAKKDNPTIEKGLMTGYSFFDCATNGVKPSDFVIIAGETGFGKSLFLNNIAVQVWLQKNLILNEKEGGEFLPGKDVIYFSLEMPYEDCFNRLLSRLSGVPSRSIENAKLNKDDFNKIKKCLNFINEYPYQFKIVDIADACANDLESILIDTNEHFDAVFIDYLGIMKPNEKMEEQDWLKQGTIAYETRAIARKYSLPIFSAIQLNRKSAGKESSENIGLNRLARSATIATHVTHVIQIENRKNEEQYPDFIYHFIKNRKGPKGKGTLFKNLACATLIDKNDELPDTAYDGFFKDKDPEDISEEIEKLKL